MINNAIYRFSFYTFLFAVIILFASCKDSNTQNKEQTDTDSTQQVQVKEELLPAETEKEIPTIVCQWKFKLKKNRILQ